MNTAYFLQTFGSFSRIKCSLILVYGARLIPVDASEALR